MPSGPQAPGSIGFRNADEKDMDFLYALHAATMMEYVDKTWGWDDAQQEAAFRKNHDPAGIQIVTYDGADIGMLYTEEREAEVFVAHIEISPEYQGRGIGSSILEQIVAGAAQRRKPVSLRVLKVNPARRLYERLGFGVFEETPTHYSMRTRLPA
ncbi:MAG: GNAT family N-acetyltransferase [Anaerolineales bacterium]